MARQLYILCAHGIDHGDVDPDLEGSWSKSIRDDLVAWNLEFQDSITCDFLKYDNLFEQVLLDKQFLNLYSQRPYESHFAAILDCCPSGGMTREGARKARGITPPDDIRHRALRWNAELQTLAEEGRCYIGSSGASHRIGRAPMAKKQYGATRNTLKHNDPYLTFSKPAGKNNSPTNTDMVRSRMGRLPIAWLRRCAQAGGRRSILRLCS